MGEYTTHATLLARLAEGADPQAWQEFHDRYGDLIRGFARRRSLQPADCDEVTQEVLTSLAQALPRFRYDPAKGKFRSYLKTVTVRTIHRRLRQKPRGPLLDVDEVDPPDRPDDDPLTDEMWEGEWRQYHLREAMKRIRAEFNENDRAAFESYALRNRSPVEVAEDLGMSIDQIYQAKSRILRRLTEIVREQVAEEG